jgi:ParB family transcriptional regulator, chromosome partitioning protein
MVEIVNELVMVETRKIKPYHRNVRHNDVTVEKLAELIPKVGFNVPLVLDRDNVIVKGHTRWKAAVRLKMPRIPCVYTDADPETVKLDRLADNRVQEFSAWDQELLGGELASLNLNFAFDLGTLDFELADNRRRPPNQTVEGDAPFISEGDVRSTASLPVNEFHEVKCNKCGNTMFVKKDGTTRRQEGGQ